MVGPVPLNRLPPLVGRAQEYAGRAAVADGAGTCTYGDLAAWSAAVARDLLEDRADLHEARVALLAPPGAAYVAGQWGTWMAGGVSVPLSPQQTPFEWEHILDDSRAAVAIVAPEYADAFVPLAAARQLRIIVAGASGHDSRNGGAAWDRLPNVGPDRRALILYTSGTTSRPKGVVLTHANQQAQVECLTDAWGWTEDDRALHVLPLNHTHGVVNILACALWNGAVCEFMDGSDAVRVWQRLASGVGGVMTRSCGEASPPYAGHDAGPSVFMAVPTIYSRLIAAWRGAPLEVRAAWSRGSAGLRLFVSGSAALPVAVLEEWRAITGHTLLERYGMTEIGMALSNPLHGARRAGFVGSPLPGVEVRLVSEAGDDVADGAPGELLVRGPGVFCEYWGRPDATAAAFAEGGWFRTGDVAARETGAFRILGRLSVDIIKTGGEKVSALEVEAVLREHPDIADCAVVGLPDAEWGEAVAAIVVLRGESTVLLPQLRDWARAKLSGPKLPRRLLTVSALPRNAMGKVVKAELRRLLGN
jgi:malonyl-CoA/methylmalonyl-CoA synthetase